MTVGQEKQMPGEVRKERLSEVKRRLFQQRMRGYSAGRE